MTNQELFEVILRKAFDESGLDREELQATIDEAQEERDTIAAQIEELQDARKAAITRAQEAENRLQSPLRKAVKSAELVGIEVPAAYLSQLRRPGGSGNSNGGRPSGSYFWQPEGLTSRTCSVSRAMWSYSRGSGGSAGTKGEGYLTSEEFWKLVEEQTGKTNLEPGEEVTLTLPNDRVLTVQRLSPMSEG